MFFRLRRAAILTDGVLGVVHSLYGVRRGSALGRGYRGFTVLLLSEAEDWHSPVSLAFRKRFVGFEDWEQNRLDDTMAHGLQHQHWVSDEVCYSHLQHIA